MRALVDKAYPSLDNVVQQQLALQKYLSQLDNEQVAFNVRQRKPKTIEAAVDATLECESYLVKPVISGVAVAPVQVLVRVRDSVLVDMMTKLMERMDRLEGNSKGTQPKREVVRRPSDQEGKAKVVVCYRCGQEGHFAWGCAQQKKFSSQGMRVPWGGCPNPKGDY